MQSEGRWAVRPGYGWRCGVMITTHWRSREAAARMQPRRKPWEAGSQENKAPQGRKNAIRETVGGTPAGQLLKLGLRTTSR
jgi:hypothetical protein